jgi:hypothetical protein
MKRAFTYILFTLLIFSCLGLQAQQKKKSSTLEFGLFLGASNYMGELTKGVVPPLNRTGPALGILTRFEINPYWSFKASAIYGRISGSDEDFDSEEFRKRRNLSFRSGIFDISTHLEWNFLGYQSTRSTNAWSPYLFGGLAVFKYNPKAQFNYVAGLHDPNLESQDGDWVELQPLGTEGQETKQFNDRKYYSLTQVAIPFGFGIKAQLSQNWAIGFEMGFRKTFTDYLDDVSKDYVGLQTVRSTHGTLANAFRDRAEEIGLPAFDDGDVNGAGEARGNDKSKDWYALSGVTITYRINGIKETCFQF